MHDIIVVGARCAGASCAMLLARKGMKVLLVDRDAKGSDMPTSTHMLWHSGVKKLKDWSLLDRILDTGCKPMRNFQLDLGEFVLEGEAPAAGDVDIALAPKRYVLDNMLIEAAIEAGVEYRQECSVNDLVWENDRVVGVKYSWRGNSSGEERARFVVGADGSNSNIAKMVSAQTDNKHDQVQGTYFAYFEDLPLNDMEFISRPGRMFYSWASNDGQTMAGMCCRYEDFRKQNKDPEHYFYSELQEFSPAMYQRVRDAKRVSEWRFGSVRGFSRTPYGQGWALVGDAGLTVDPISAVGISLALRDAENLADAIYEGLSGQKPIEDSLQEFTVKRDSQSLPMLQFSQQMGMLEEPPEEVIEMFIGLNGNSEDTSAYFGVFAQTVPVTTFFDPDNIQRIIEKGRAAIAAT